MYRKVLKYQVSECFVFITSTLIRARTFRAQHNKLHENHGHHSSSIGAKLHEYCEVVRENKTLIANTAQMEQKIIDACEDEDKKADLRAEAESIIAGYYLDGQTAIRAITTKLQNHLTQ